MRIKVFRKATFNAAHRLNNPLWSKEKNQEVFGACNHDNYHGHNYTLVVRLEGEVDAETGYLMDLKVLKKYIAEEVTDQFDHRNLNLDIPEFNELNPTAENIAFVIWHKLRNRIPESLDLGVVLYETERNFVEYEGK